MGRATWNKRRTSANAKFQGEKVRSREEKRVLTAYSIARELIADQCQLKLKENQDAYSITEAAVLKVRKRTKFGNFVGDLRNFRKRSEIALTKKQGVKNEWEYSDENKEVDSANQIDQLNARRFDIAVGKA